MSYPRLRKFVIEGVGNDVADDAPAFQAAINAAIADGGGTVVAPNPPVAWRLATPVHLDLSALSSIFCKGRLDFFGEGPNAIINSVCPGWAVTISGGATFGNGGERLRMRMGGLTMRGLDPHPGSDRRGLLVRRAIHIDFEDFFFYEFHRATRLEDVVAFGFDGCGWEINNRGVEGAAGPNYPPTGSPANEGLFKRCHFIGNRNKAAAFDRCGNIVFSGGSFEGTGLPLANIEDEVDGVTSLSMMNSGLNAVVALDMTGTHFETNRGHSDIRIVHGSFPCIYNARGVDFIQNGPTNYVAHHIHLDTPGASKALVSVSGCGFHGVNGYAPSSGRRVIHEGDVVGSLHAWDIGPNLYTFDEETPAMGARVVHGFRLSNCA